MVSNTKRRILCIKKFIANRITITYSSCSLFRSRTKNGSQIVPVGGIRTYIHAHYAQTPPLGAYITRLLGIYEEQVHVSIFLAAVISPRLAARPTDSRVLRPFVSRCIRPSCCTLLTSRCVTDRPPSVRNNLSGQRGVGGAS